jgi:hypothetical protein
MRAKQDKCGPNKCNTDSRDVGIVIGILFVVVVVGGCIGTGIGLMCCYNQKCCCWAHRRFPGAPGGGVPNQVGQQMSSTTAHATATPVGTGIACQQQPSAMATAVATPVAAAYPPVATAVACQQQPFAMATAVATPVSGGCQA